MKGLPPHPPISFTINQIFEYDPATDVLTTKKATLHPSGKMGRSLSCAENSATNKIYCFGGNSRTDDIDQIIEYDPTTDTLQIKTENLPLERRALACT